MAVWELETWMLVRVIDAVWRFCARLDHGFVVDWTTELRFSWASMITQRSNSFAFADDCP